MAVITIYNCQWCRKEMRRKPNEVNISTPYGTETEKICNFCYLRRNWNGYREETKRKNGLWWGY
jgi:hypothetical protein